MFRSDYHGAVMIDFVAETKGGGIKVASWRKQNKRYWHDTFNEKL
jgi:hypothetical protein